MSGEFSACRARRHQGSSWPRREPRPEATATLSPSPSLLQVGVELVEELVGRQPRVVGADQNSEVAGHVIAFHRLDADLFHTQGEIALEHDLAAVVQLEKPPQLPWRLHLTPRQSAASAAFSVALGRIPADVLV